MKKRLLALLMAGCIIMGTVPAFAVDAAEDESILIVSDADEAASNTDETASNADETAQEAEQPAADSGEEDVEETAVLKPNEVSITVGESKTVSLSVSPETVGDTIASAVSDNESVASASASDTAVTVTGIAAGECTVTVTTANGLELTLPVTIGPKTGELAEASVAMKGSTKVRLGNHIYMHATISGLSGPVSGVTVNWYLNGTKVKSKSGVTLKNGTKLSLKKKLSKKTTRKQNKVTIKLSKKGSTTVSGTAQVTSIFDFVGAKVTKSKRSNITVGSSMKVTMKISGLRESLHGSYLWYVDGKKVGSRVSKKIKNGTKFTLKYTAKKSGKHKIVLVLKNKDGSRKLKRTKTITVHKKFSKVLATYTTSFDASNVNRSTNLRLATRSINGTVLKPGAVFSYNGVVGERTAARGYRQAIIFVGGQSVAGLGGGVCQVSSTLFNAVLYANLAIVERHYHSARVSYVPMGRDATVAWGSKDFRFRNSLSKPIKISATYNPNGSITMKILADYGTKTPKVKLSVTRAGSGYCLRRYANGNCNYVTYSYY